MQKLCFYFFFKFGRNTSITMQQTSKWEKHLPYLHVGTLSVHNSISENYKNPKKIQAHVRYLG